MKRYHSLLFFFVMLFCISCPKPKPTPTPPIESKPTYTENFITVHFKADSQVNLYDGSAHALHVCIYQLSDPNAFNLLSEDEAGIAKLMSCDRPEVVTTIPGAAIAKRYVMQPGDDKTNTLDRAEGAKYVGVVAGYYTLQKRNAVQLYPIPVAQEKKDGVAVIAQKPLKLEIYLGPQSLDLLGGKP